MTRLFFRSKAFTPSPTDKWKMSSFSFGACGNEISPADGHVVHAEYGCGAHSELRIEQGSPVLVADLIYDDSLLDVERAPAE